MKNQPAIQSALAWRLRVPLLPDLCASPEFGGQPIGPDRLILKLTDNTGHIGWGEGHFSSADNLQNVLQSIVDKPLASFRTQFLDLWTPGASYWHLPTPPSPYASPDANLRHRLRHPFQTPFEMALLDLSCRRAGTSLSQHFGGQYRDAIPTDYWMGRVTPKDAKRLVKRGIKLGFHGVKIKTTLQDPNVQRLQAIRQASGSNDFAVTVDPNQRFLRLDDARSTILDMDKVGNMRVLEDPFPRMHLHEAAALRPQISARIVVHLEDPQYLHAVIQSGAAGGINIDSHTVGLANWRSLAAAADAANLPVWHGSALDLGIYTAAQLHLAAVTPNCQLPGDQIGPWLRESHLLKQPFTIKKGAIVVPTGPGLGIEVDQSLVEHYAVEAFSA